MPNWCNNKLVISGTVENIAEFKKTLGPKGEFKFAQTVPMPRELLEITTGSNLIGDKRYSQWREETLTPPRIKTRKARKAAIAVEATDAAFFAPVAASQGQLLDIVRALARTDRSP